VKFASLDWQISPLCTTIQSLHSYHTSKKKKNMNPNPKISNLHHYAFFILGSLFINKKNEL